jgi:hypothetical protein
MRLGTSPAQENVVIRAAERVRASIRFLNSAYIKYPFPIVPGVLQKQVDKKPAHRRLQLGLLVQAKASAVVGIWRDWKNLSHVMREHARD